MLPGQMLGGQLEYLNVCRRLPLKLVQKRFSNRGDIADIEFQIMDI